MRRAYSLTADGVYFKYVGLSSLKFARSTHL